MKRLILALVMGLGMSQGFAFTLKVATLSPDGSAWMSKMRAGAAEVEKRTQGRVAFKFYTGGTMGNDKAVLSKIKIGQLHGGAVTAGSLADYNRDIQVYAMPLKFKSFAEVDYVRARMDAPLSRSLESGGMVNFGFAEAGFAYAMSKTAPIPSVAELRKHKVWIPENDPQSAEALKAFRVAPIPLSLADVLPGLQTGMVDTVASSPIGTLALQWHTQVKYVTDLPLSYIVGVLAIDQKAFARIDAPDQAVVREVMVRVFRDIDRQNRQDNLAAWDTLLKQGIKAVRPSASEVAEWERDALQAGDRIVKAGIVSPAVIQQLDDNIKAYRAGTRS
jgi:TRAP-type C4-dicarboxylate transport system substrate-binding protein